MRSLVALAALIAAVSAGAPHAAVDTSRVKDLLTGIAQDIGAIYDAFAGGPNDPHSPVNDQVALRDAASHLDSATARANQLADELQRVQQP
jgi:hypothetical protein